MAKLLINGDIVPDDEKFYYDWFDEPCTCPGMVREAVDNLQDGETLTVEINSPGGYVMAGQEIYTILRGVKNLEIRVQSIAASAASIIACAGKCLMSPISMLMIHNVSGSASGDYRDMEHMSDTLKTFNAALCQAYVSKTGKTEAEILQMMDDETWLTAQRAVELGFADGIIEDAAEPMTNAGFGLKITPEMKEQVRKEIAEKENAKEAEYHSVVDDLDDFGV